MKYSLIIVLTCSSLILSAIADCGCSQSRQPRSEGSQAKDETKKSDGFCSAESNKHDKYDNMVLIEGGTFSMGTDQPVIVADGEYPARKKTVNTFYLDATEVSNEQFEKFVNATGYRTDAEVLGDSFVLSTFVKNEKHVKGAVQAVPWWWSVSGATWKHPEGPESELSGRMDHPVVHVSWTDAKKYCEHYGKRLPKEAEWEMACKKALDGYQFPWDDKVVPADAQRSANIWQGKFPDKNLKSDGYEGTAPVTAYGKMKGLPLKNMIGNVWEWTADVWNVRHDEPVSNDLPNRVKKGGSYMCHASYCYRYRCEARNENTLDTSAGNVGFRCAADA